MLKWIAALAVLLAIVPAPLPGQASGQASGDQKVTISTTEPLKVQADIPKDWRDKLNWLLSVILVLIGGFGVLYARKTLKAIESQLTEIRAAGKQTDRMIEHASTQAKAALLSVQAVINTERPWIVVRVERKGGSEFIFTATNVGRTPAEIVAIQTSIPTFVEAKAGLPETPQHANNILDINEPFLLPPTDTTNLVRFNINAWGEHRMAGVTSGRVSAFIFGRIAYLDLTEKATGVHTVHETCWCRWYVPVKGGNFINDGYPAAYSRYN
jgi:hypothetical protein